MSDVPVPTPTRDELARARRRALTEAERARLIQRLWHDLGHRDVRAWVERAGPIRVVRSNLINGMPPSALGLVETVDWKAVAARFRDTIADDEWERMIREHTTWKAA